MMTTYEARAVGRDYCNDTEGSDHYKGGDVEPLDLIISKGLTEGFCIGSIIKYVVRYLETQNLQDLRKACDYIQIFCGVEMSKPSETEWVKESL